MTARRHRMVGVAAVMALGVGLTVSACRPVEAGAAATVGDTRITTDQLRGLVDRGLADPTAAQQYGSDRASFQRQWLTRLVDRALLEDVASDLGVSLTDQQVDATMASFQQQVGSKESLEQQAAQLGIARSDLTGYVRDIALQQAVTEKLTADEPITDAQLRAAYQANISQYETVHAAHILVADKATADMIYAQLQADPSKFAALAKQYSTDTATKDNGGDLGTVSPGQFVEAFDKAVFAASSGQLLPPLQTQFGWHVIKVIDKTTVPFEQAKAGLLSQLQDQQQQTVLQDRLKQAADQARVRVNPRFGVWSADSQSVVASTSTLSSPQPSAAAAGASSPDATPTPTPSGG